MGYLTVPQNFDPTENDHVDEKVQIPSFKKKGLKCHYSDVVNSYIVDAITGEKYPWRVGSKDEERFFRVITTVNEENPHRRTSRKAFYENPEAYMQYTGNSLDEDLVNQWYEVRGSHPFI